MRVWWIGDLNGAREGIDKKETWDDGRGWGDWPNCAVGFWIIEENARRTEKV